MTNRFLLISILLGGLFACKTPQQTAPKMASLPTQFPNSKGDSANTPLPKWKNYYFDSTLSGLIEKALDKNFDYQAAIRRVELFRAGVVFNKGNQLPDLNANVAGGIRRFGKYTMDGVGNYDTKFSPNLSENQKVPDPMLDYYMGFQSSWEWDLWGKLKSRRKAAYHRFMAGEMGKNLVLTSTISEVAKAYYHLLALDNELKIYQENIELQQNALNVVRIQKQTGQANELGVEIMEAQLLASREKELEVAQQIIIAENGLHFFLGRLPEKLERQSNGLDKNLLPSISTGFPSSLLQNRPDVQMAENQIKAAGADLVAAKTAFYPSLNINASIGLQAFRYSLLLDPASTAFSGLGGLAAPLLNRRMLKAQLLQAETEQKLSYIEYEKTITRSFLEVYNAQSQVQNLERMIEIKNQEVSLLRNAISTSSDLFRTGRASYLEVNNAQRNALQSQLELLNLKRFRLLSQVELYRALGGGWK
jgi:NodT family efflux transporter outer membrane factor (OMF) lipoprotein